MLESSQSSPFFVHLVCAAFLVFCLTLLIQPALAQSMRSVRQDLDGDGKSDIVLSNRRTGDVKALFMNSTAIARQSLLVQGMDPNWTISRTGDFDGDGKTDLIWRNSQTGDVVVWFMDGSTTRSWGTIASGLNTTWFCACDSRSHISLSPGCRTLDR